jgi:hypothetical protein
MNILMSKLQVMFNGLYFNSIFKKIAASLHHSLNPLAESPAGLGHGVPGEVRHSLHDLRHQGGGSVVGGFVCFSFTKAPNVVVHGVTVWAAGRPDLLRLELREVLPAPLLGGFAVMGGRPVLLKHEVVPSTIIVAGKLVAIITGTSLMSTQSHLLFYLLTFWS